MKVQSSWAKLGKLERSIKNIGKKAVRAGAKIVLQAARAAAPVRSGALQQSLASKVDSFKGEVTAYGLVGPRSNYVKAVGGKLVVPARYSHLIERGKFARPFLAPSWQATRGAYVKTAEDVLRTEFSKITGG